MMDFPSTNWETETLKTEEELFNSDHTKSTDYRLKKKSDCVF